MNIAKFDYRKTACVVSIAFAVGCDANRVEEAQSESAAAPPSDAVTSVPLGTFAATPSGRVDAGFDTRLPGTPEQSILVAATTLFPGMHRIEPNIRNPFSDAEAVAAGERHFAAFNCAGCHAPLGGGGMGPPLSDDAWIYGGEPAQIYLSIMHGRAQGMPAWSSMLPGRTVWELVAYIESLADIEDYAQAKGFEPRSPFRGPTPPRSGNEAAAETVAR